MARTFRTMNDPSVVEELLNKDGLAPPFEHQGREILDPRPMSVPVKVRQQLGPLDQMYANIRAQEAIAREAAHMESDEESEDFDIPEELDEFFSKYEETPIQHLLGSAFKDRRVQKALRKAIEGQYGIKEAEELNQLYNELNPAPAASPAAPAPSPGDEAGASAPPAPAGAKK